MIKAFYREPCLLFWHCLTECKLPKWTNKTFYQQNVASSALIFIILLLVTFLINLFMQQQKSGQRMKCSACQLIAHQNCIPIVNEKTQLACKPTFRDVGVRQYREQSTTHHHWVHRKMEKGKCKQCGKVSKSNVEWRHTNYCSNNIIPSMYVYM